MKIEESECVVCHEVYDNFIMFEGEICFTCAIDEHFEKLKKEENECK